MSRNEVDYDDLKQEMIEEMENHLLMVLATSDGKKVSARTVMCVFDELNILIGTKINSRKYQQIQSNPFVALADGRIQVEGKAILRGHPINGKDSKYIELFKEQNPIRYENQSSRGNFVNPYMRIIEINPTRIAYYVQGPTSPESYIAVIEPETQSAYHITRESEQF